MKEEYNVEEGDENVYEEEGREDLVEDGEITPEENAFMKGYEEANKDEDE